MNVAKYRHFKIFGGMWWYDRFKKDLFYYVYRNTAICRRMIDNDDKPLQLIPLEQETRSAIPTSEAAGHLSRAEQTMRLWACRECGPLRPIRINGRLAWPVAELRRILGV